MDHTKSTCPACRSPRVVSVTRDAPGLELAEHEHWLISTDNPIGEGDPDWHCHACGYEWIKPLIR